MRNPGNLLPVLLSVTLASATVMAGDHYSHSHSSDDDLTWSSDGNELNLHSSSTSGVIVGPTTPSTFHGLKTGDVVEAVGDRKVARVGELLNALRDQCGTAATLHVRRAGTPIALTWKHSECETVLPLPPPP